MAVIERNGWSKWHRWRPHLLCARASAGDMDPDRPLIARWRGSGDRTLRVPTGASASPFGALIAPNVSRSRHEWHHGIP